MALRSHQKINILKALAASSLLFALSACSCYKPYDVGKNDTVSSICRRFGLTEEELRARNRMESDYEVRPGDRVFLPCGAREIPVEKSVEKPIEKPSVKAAPPPPAKPKPAEPEAKPKPAQEYKSSAAARLHWPVKGEIVRKFSEGEDAPSHGIDLKAPGGTGVHAAEEGRVEYAGAPANAYGPMVLLAHSGGLYTVYSHLGRIDAKTGDRVAKGQKIGVCAFDTYVHFEVREGKKPVDPLLYLPRP